MFTRETNAKHEAIIRRLVEDAPGCRINGFAEAVRQLRAELGEEAEPAPSFRPDAFRINRETQEIEIYEVEVRHALSEAKIERLGEFWFSWDSEGEQDWLPVLIVVNRYGGQQRIDLRHAYYRTGPLDP